MVLVLEQINVEGIAQLSYLVGDDKAGVAAVIDPGRDVDVYLQMAHSLGVRITHIILLKLLKVIFTPILSLVRTNYKPVSMHRFMLAKVITISLIVSS